MRDSFTYWYPLDLRVSGKDLIKNHLTMALYNHSFVFNDNNMLPRSYYCNGYILVNGIPMSKSKGNFKTIEGVCKEFGADATRITLADCGDTLEDANFLTKQADITVNRLYSFENFLKILTHDNWQDKATVTEVPELLTSNDRVFNNTINYLIEKSRIAFDELKYKEVLKYGYFEMLV